MKSRRLLDMVTAGALVVGLGLVIAVSARSLPGQDDQEPLLDVVVGMPPFLALAFQWFILATAGLLALFLLFSLAKVAPREWPPRRRWLGLIVWIFVFALMYYFVRPVAEEAVSETLPPVESVEETPTTSVATSAAWMVSILMAAVIAAALARVGMTVRSRDWSLEPQEEEPLPPASGGVPPPRVAAVVGTDPRSRAITAYAAFEEGATNAGMQRRVAETPRRHAARVTESSGLEPDDVQILGEVFSEARFGDDPVAEESAASAESALDRIRGRWSG